MFFEGLINVMSVSNLMLAFFGCFMGTLVGVLPGLGPVSAVAILFPLTAFLPPEGMIIALAAIYYGAMYGGSTTAILMKIPGEVASLPATLDGYELTKQGKAGPALAIAAIVSYMAGMFGTLVLCIVGPGLAKYCLKFGPPEYLSLAIFSLTAIAGLSANSLSRGLIMAVSGMLLATVGTDVLTSIPRFAYGSETLLNGLDIAPVMIGIFGIGEILKDIGKPDAKMYEGKIGRLMPNKEDFKTCLGAGWRGTLIGTILGVLPGMLASITSFLSYSYEKQRSKNPEKFGKGAVEGLAGAGCDALDRRQAVGG